MNKKLVISLVILSVAALGFSVFNFVRPTFQPAFQPIETEVGAIPGNELQGPCLKVNGLETCFGSVALTTATNTPCRLKSPAATSTLILASVFMKTATSTVTYVELAKTTNALRYATTTSLGTQVIGASASGMIIATTTSVNIFSPNDWFVVKVAGGTGSAIYSGWAGFVPTGSCRAEWIIN